MQRYLLFCALLFVPIVASPRQESQPEALPVSPVRELYRALGLSDKVDYALFEHAYSGYNRIAGKHKAILTLIDFTKPSTDKRLYVLDLDRQKLLFETHVAHGRNSGENYATSFSNRNGSYQSSLGFYLTENTYIGKNGYSLVLNGLEPNINDNAKARAVVVHGAAYADPAVARAQGRLGRSLGCPALPLAVSRKVIDTIKDGSVLFVYADQPDYLAQSAYSPKKMAKAEI
jgi:hypothetical protein